MTETHTVKVHLMRHGEVHNPERIVYGRLPGYRLSEKGRQMVRLSAEEFAARAEDGARFVHLVCSPLQRTRESAAPVEELLGLTAQPDERVIEADNYFEGLHVNAQELLRNPRHWTKLYNPTRPSWGESYLEQVRSGRRSSRLRNRRRGGGGDHRLAPAADLDYPPGCGGSPAAARPAFPRV